MGVKDPNLPPGVHGLSPLARELGLVATPFFDKRRCEHHTVRDLKHGPKELTASAGLRVLTPTGGMAH